MLRLNRFPTAREAAEMAGHAIAQRIRDMLVDRDAVTLVISGGSTPIIMFQELARAEADWERVHVFFADERCVAPDNADSNYRMAREHLFEPARLPESNIHRIMGELLPTEAASRYVDELDRYFKGEPVTFDVLHLGMGADGHTASLFPEEPLIQSGGVAAAVYAKPKQQWRVTVLPPIIQRARYILMLAAGEDKAHSAKEALKGAASPLQLPAKLAANAEWFLDNAAAALLG